MCVSQPNLFCWDAQILDELDFVIHNQICFCWDPQILDELDFVLSVHKINVVAVVMLVQIFVQELR